MTPRERLIAPLGFVLAGALFLFTTFIPLAKGQPIKIVFLPLGIVFLMLGLAAWRRVRSTK